MGGVGVAKKLISAKRQQIESVRLTMEYWEDGDWYVGQILEVPGVMSQGATLRELEQNIWDAYWLINPQTVGIHGAKVRLSALLAQVAAGQHFTITKRRQPVAQLIPLERRKPVRRPGLFKGRIRIARDFDAPISEWRHFSLVHSSTLTTKKTKGSEDPSL